MCWIHLLVLLAPAIWQVDSHNATAYKELLAKLNDSEYYDAGLRPNITGDAVAVEIDLVLNSVGPVQEMDMTWTASFYLRQEWVDDRLVIGPGAGRVKMDGSHISEFWVPDVFFSNNKDGRKHHLTVDNHLLYVNGTNGRILYSQRLTVVSNCEMDLIKFPHDSQTCDIKLESYSFTTDDLTLGWSTSRSATSLLPTAYIPDFAIDDVSVSDCSATYAIGTYPCLKATVHMRREIGYYIFQTYLPSVLIVILSWASFWIDHEAVPARISVGLLTVLTITTQLSGSRSQLPRVPYIKAIDVWMSTNLVFVFAAYMEYAVVTVLSRRYKKKKMKDARNLPLDDSQELSVIQIHLADSTEKSTTENGGPVANGSSPTFQIRRPSSPSSPLPVLDSTDTGRRLDKRSRFMFPLVFAVFNVTYWTYYLAIA
ncbi:glycine receptor subunit alpha-2-like [Littorina saxatilis]|uniref:Uncharacterized protein n=1 Tax=Littorina saxatilis TaxID=31220 RepID=A0AAN9BAL3_9CAEN